MQVRTARGDGDLSVDFNEQVWMPVMVPTMTHRIELSMWDNNVVGKDSVVANAYFSFQDLQVRALCAWLCAWLCVRIFQAVRSMACIAVRGCVDG